MSPRPSRPRRQLPELSRLELQCLRRLWTLGEGSVRAVHSALPDAPSYSTVRKIFERLEEKGAVARVRLDGRAWVYRSAVPPADMIRKEVRRLLDGLFDGQGGALAAQLADMNALTLQDLREIERRTGWESGGAASDRSAPDRAASGRSASDRSASDRAASDRSALDCSADDAAAGDPSRAARHDRRGGPER